MFSISSPQGDHGSHFDDFFAKFRHRTSSVAPCQMLDDNLFKNDVDKKASFPQSSTATKMHEIGEHDEVFELEGDQIEKYADLEKIQELVLATVNLRFCFYLT